MFLESLLRRDHFEKGRFVLHNKVLNVEREIIQPQLDHYKNRLLERGITIEQPGDLSNQNFIIQADPGLLAQVYANFFSNAVKYTKEIIDKNGNSRKVMAYGGKILPDYYGKGQPGIKFNVFTTGPHLNEVESANIFIDGFKGYNCNEINSHGHGLAFVKMVVELHDGEVGHDLTEQGNNFFFILPLLGVEAPTS
jgi:signal transduction histidine kinase